MLADDSVRARIDSRTKSAATAALAAMGLSVSDAIRLMMRRIAEEQRLPFDVKVPNAESVAAMTELNAGRGKRFATPDALFDDLGIWALRDVVRSTAFRKDLKCVGRRGRDMAKLKAVILLLLDDAPLDPRYRDHPLKGVWSGYRDLHIEPDWLLLYRATDIEVYLARTGAHADLFGE